MLRKPMQYSLRTGIKFQQINIRAASQLTQKDNVGELLGKAHNNVGKFIISLCKMFYFHQGILVIFFFFFYF